jgi:two-component system, sensor histidine kinase PdtaS
MTKEKVLLLVEDESIVALAETQKLRLFGYEVLVASSGEKAIELANGSRKIDLILMDIDLGDGIEGSEAARRILETRNLPIVFLTGHSEKERVESVKEITRYGYVIKNSSDFVLQSSIEMAFELFEANERIRLERDELREAKETAERYLNVAAALIVSLDTSGKIILVNDSGCKLLGFDREELIGKDWFETCLPPGPRESSREEFQELIQSKTPIVQNSESIIITKNGSIKTVLWHHTLCKYRNGRISGTIHSGEDVTERKQVREDLRDSEERLREIIERMVDYIYTVYYENGSPVRTLHNPACETVTGYKAEEFAADPHLWFKMIVPEDRERVEKHTARIAYETAPEAIEHRIKRKDGTLRWIRNTPVLHFDSSGRLAFRDGIVVDITERKLAEEKVTSLLREKEILLKEVNHRIRNNMTSLGSLLALQANAAQDPNVSAALYEAQGRVHCMQALYDKLFRHGDHRFILAKEYFNDLIWNIKSSALCPASNISLGFQGGDVLLDADYLFPLGILTNELITNAIKHAFPNGRAGTIRVDFQTPSDKECELTVADDGIGFSMRDKDEDSSGLGLELVNALIEQLHGQLKIVREAGTEFRVTFAVEKSKSADGEGSDYRPMFEEASAISQNRPQFARKAAVISGSK